MIQTQALMQLQMLRLWSNPVGASGPSRHHASRFPYEGGQRSRPQLLGHLGQCQAPSGSTAQHAPDPAAAANNNGPTTAKQDGCQHPLGGPLAGTARVPPPIDQPARRLGPAAPTPSVFHQLAR